MFSILFLLTWQARTKETVSMRHLRPLRTVSQRYGLFVVDDNRIQSEAVGKQRLQARTQKVRAFRGITYYKLNTNTNR